MLKEIFISVAGMVIATWIIQREKQYFTQKAELKKTRSPIGRITAIPEEKLDADAQRRAEKQAWGDAERKYMREHAPPKPTFINANM